MPTSSALADLLIRLRAARSPLARLRAAAEAWRTLQALTPEERSRVASEIGMEGASDLVDRLAARSGLDAGAVLDAIREAETRDPGRLRALLRPDDGRPAAAPPRDLLHRGLAALESLVTTGSVSAPAAMPAPAVPDTPPPPAETAPEGSGPAAAEADLAEVLPPAPAVPASPAPVPEPAPPVLPTPPDAVPAPPLPPPAPRTTRAEVAAARRHATRTVTAPTAAAAASLSSTPPPADRTRTATAAPAPSRVTAASPAAPADAAALAAALAGAPSLLARLAVARDRAADLARLPSADLAELLDVFEAGWARRRVVTAIIEADRPGADRALQVIGLLRPPRDRRWCLSAMLGRRDLPERDRSVLADRLAEERRTADATT